MVLLTYLFSWYHSRVKTMSKNRIDCMYIHNTDLHGTTHCQTSLCHTWKCPSLSWGMLIVTKYHNDIVKMTSVFLVTIYVTLLQHCLLSVNILVSPGHQQFSTCYTSKTNAFHCTEHWTLVTDTTSKDVTQLLAVVRCSFITHNYIILTLEVQAWLCNIQGC
jgi:hypothetical protein